MKQDQKTKPTTTKSSVQEFKGVQAKKVKFNPNDDDDPMLTTDCAKYFASLSPEEQQEMRDKADGELNLDWMFDSFDEFSENLDKMVDQERERLLQVLEEKAKGKSGGMICFCRNPNCHKGYFVPVDSVRRYRER